HVGVGQDPDRLVAGLRCPRVRELVAYAALPRGQLEPGLHSVADAHGDAAVACLEVDLTGADFADLDRAVGGLRCDRRPRGSDLQIPVGRLDGQFAADLAKADGPVGRLEFRGSRRGLHANGTVRGLDLER